MKEPNSRIIIDKLLRESDWILYGDEGVVNVDLPPKLAPRFG
jgi:hypothetical protein